MRIRYDVQAPRVGDRSPSGSSNQVWTWPGVLVRGLPARPASLRRLPNRLATTSGGTPRGRRCHKCGRRHPHERTLDGMGWASLGVALAHIPNLTGAACAGRWELFDLQPFPRADRAMREAQALTLCAHCPALLECKRWLDSMPPSVQPYGVIAGRVHRPAKSKAAQHEHAGARRSNDAAI
jgi:WhiB family transcriptional regulator, redox-sensing transcriptional regulator